MRNYKKKKGKQPKKQQQNKVPFITKLWLWFECLLFPKRPITPKPKSVYGLQYLKGRANAKGAFGTCKYLKAKRRGLPV